MRCSSLLAIGWPIHYPLQFSASLLWFFGMVVIVITDLHRKVRFFQPRCAFGGMLSADDGRGILIRQSKISPPMTSGKVPSLLSRLARSPDG